MRFKNVNGLNMLEAEQNEVIINKNQEIPNISFASVIYLGKYDNVNNYITITTEEAEALKKEQEAVQEANRLEEEALRAAERESK